MLVKGATADTLLAVAREAEAHRAGNLKCIQYTPYIMYTVLFCFVLLWLYHQLLIHMMFNWEEYIPRIVMDAVHVALLRLKDIRKVSREATLIIMGKYTIWILYVLIIWTK